MQKFNRSLLKLIRSAAFRMSFGKPNRIILDGHIHIMSDGIENQMDFLQKLGQSGIDGGIVISMPPSDFPSFATTAPPHVRIQHVLNWCELNPNLYPFYWIDPLDDSAAEQVDIAVDQGVMGFKIICDRYFPWHEKAMEVYSRIAKTNRPILFHSGILWDAKHSSRFNRPSEFEVLLDIDGLRFCLAHISWPWCDELIAVYGKFMNVYRKNPNQQVEMFIDIAPGTPPIYRKEALSKLFTVGYDIENNVIFGTDSSANAYNVKWAKLSLYRD